MAVAFYMRTRKIWDSVWHENLRKFEKKYEKSFQALLKGRCWVANKFIISKYQPYFVSMPYWSTLIHKSIHDILVYIRHPYLVRLSWRWFTFGLQTSSVKHHFSLKQNCASFQNTCVFQIKQTSLSRQSKNSSLTLILWPYSYSLLSCTCTSGIFGGKTSCLRNRIKNHRVHLKLNIQELKVYSVIFQRPAL